MGCSDWNQAVSEYLADCERRGLRPATIRYYRTLLRRLASSIALDSPGDLTLARIRAFQDDPGGLGPASMRGYLRATKTFTRWLADEDLIERDPLVRLRLPRVDARVLEVPTDSELIALLRASAPPLRIVVVLLAATGLRIGDVTALTLSGVRDHALLLTKTKNRVGRLVPLDPVLDALLARDRAPVGHGSRAMFLSRTGRPLTADATRLALADARKRAGLQASVTPHVLRHWHARDLASHGTGERLLAARMGWRAQELIGRYAPVATWELEREVDRYAPLVRLRDEGLLEGLLPPAVLRAGPRTESKNEDDRPGTARGRS